MCAGIDNDQSTNTECYDVGYKFRKKFLSDSKEEEWVDGVVTGMGERWHDRLVQYNQGAGTQELLHVDDLKELPPLPMFNYSLCAGDKIGYMPFRRTNVVIATVYEIGDAIFRSGKVHISTSGLLAALCVENPKLRIISSDHDDAPPVGQWTSIEQVNLVRGKIDDKLKAKDKEKD